MKADLRWLAENVEWPGECPSSAHVTLDPDGEVRFIYGTNTEFDFYPENPPLYLTADFAGLGDNTGYSKDELIAAKVELIDDRR